MRLPKKPELKILKERKRKKIQAKRKKERAKKKKEQDKKLKKQIRKKKYRLPRKEGRLNRTKDYTATIYYLIMIFVGLVMLMIFLGGT